MWCTDKTLERKAGSCASQCKVKITADAIHHGEYVTSCTGDGLVLTTVTVGREQLI